MTGFIKRRIVTNETLGERLRKIREGRELDFGEIEMTTGIKASYLECLEEGDYGSLPGEVYVKNFLKVYGVFLGMDEERIIEQYDKERKVDDYKAVAQYAAGGRDLFGNKPRAGWFNFKQRLKMAEAIARVAKGIGWKKIKQKKIFFRNVVLSQIIIKGITALLILGVFFYLGWEVKGILSPPDLTVFEPADNLVIQETRIEIRGIVEEGAELKINGSDVVYDREGNFSEIIDLREGLNEIKVSAKKKRSREAVEVRRIMVE